MISIIYSTNRKEPKFDWFIDSLYRQIPISDRNNIELIFIDYDWSIQRSIDLQSIIDGRFIYIHHSPKDNLYQGRKRKTRGEYFSPSNARNTGVIASQGDYLVFCDDVSVLQFGWWEAVKRASNENKIVCGAYQKHFELIVDDGNILSSRGHSGGIDGRWDIGGVQPVKISGGQMYGCSFGIPANVMILVNGFDELCDSIGSEDYQLGMRLNNAGYQIWYDRTMYTIESEELHNQPYLMKREDRVLDEEKYMKRLKDFGVYKRSTTGNTDSSHMILDILIGSHQIVTLGNNYNIGFFRQTATSPFSPEDKNHWFDNKPLIEML